MSIYLPDGVIHMDLPTMPELSPEIEQAIDESGCCWGSVVRGADHCTCWEPVFDLEQQEPRIELDVQTRSTQCDDCAYRCDSPERTGDGYVAENLLDLPSGDNPFWCHKGMRRPIKHVHPLGLEVPGEAADYRPPQIGQVLFKADGTPADICGGYALRRRKLDKGATS